MTMQLPVIAHTANSPFAVRGFMTTVFAPFALFHLPQAAKLDYLPATVCIMGAVYFVLRA